MWEPENIIFFHISLISYTNAAFIIYLDLNKFYIIHVRGQRNATKTVGTGRGHQRADRLKTTVTEN